MKMWQEKGKRIMEGVRRSNLIALPARPKIVPVIALFFETPIKMPTELEDVCIMKSYHVSTY